MELNLEKGNKVEGRLKDEAEVMLFGFEDRMRLALDRTRKLSICNGACGRSKVDSRFMAPAIPSSFL